MNQIARSHDEGRSPTVVLGLVVVLVVLALLVDQVAGGSADVVPRPVETTLLAGSTTCAAATLGASSELVAALVTDPGEGATGATDVASGGDDARGTVRFTLADGEDVRELPPPAIDGRARAVAVAGDGGDVLLTARWDGVPTLLSRRWEVSGTERVPGAVEGPCPTEPATDWYVPGVVTAGGASAQLHLANPTGAAASLGVSFTTPDGPVAPTRLANLVVPARGRTTVDLNEFVPEEPDLGVVVTTRTGRVVVEAVQTLEAAVGGVDARSLVVAHPEARDTWTLPWIAADDGQTPWVWVTNPSDEPTDVRLVVHTPTGPVVPPASGVTLSPGSTERIDLRGALTELGVAAVTVRSVPEVPIVASGVVLRSVEDDPVRGGVAVVAATQPGPGLRAALSTVGGDGRQRLLQLANPGEEEAVVDVRVMGDDPRRPRTVATGRRIDAGTSVTIELDEQLPAEGGFAVLVEATEGTVTGALVTSSDAGPLDLTAVALQPFPSSITTTERPVRRDPTLLHPIRGDRLAPSPAPTGAPSPAPTGTPSPSAGSPSPAVPAVDPSATPAG